ncbi:hypothetical protein [Aerophototrophica crusticola]|uniref:hypothetical protein n=1 Tax=Aerophototrophica crusticola TaxID=1709002 RepID=UPI0009FAB62E
MAADFLYLYADAMDKFSINTEADYAAALREVEAYFRQEPDPESPDAARFDALAAAIEAYEALFWQGETIQEMRDAP